jgi:hypothetical protein
MRKKILLVLLMLLLLSVLCSAKPAAAGKQKNIKVEAPEKNETGCGYFLDGVWYEYECCSDEECGEGSACIDHECVRLECSGDMNLNLRVEDGRIKAEVKGIENCEGKTVRIKDGSCEGHTVCSFVWNATECYFDIPKPGTYEYFACLDMNGDGNYSSDEVDKEELVVAPYIPENQTTGGGSSGSGDGGDEAWGFLIPIGLFFVILVLILTPWLHESMRETKKRKKKV